MKISELFDLAGSDKNTRHLYGSFYDSVFDLIHPKNVLEIGVLQGASATAFESNGCRYVGVDMDPIEGFEIIKAKAPDFSPVVQYCGSTGIMFDLIIDDGSHDPNEQIAGYRSLLRYLNHGGFYIVEDLSNNAWIETMLVKHGSKIVDFRSVTGHADSCIAYWRK
jgi:hypothetical protein